MDHEGNARAIESLWPGWRVESRIARAYNTDIYTVCCENLPIGFTYRAALRHVSIPSQYTQYETEELPADARRQVYDEQRDTCLRDVGFMMRLKDAPHIMNYEHHQVVPRENGEGYDLFIRTELLEGLSPYIHATCRLRDPEICGFAARLGIDMAKALQSLEEIHCLHRNIKPGNIYVDAGGRFKLGDFTCACIITPPGRDGIAGTPDYMAPEIYLGKQYGATVDIYSLGIVLYRYLNGGYHPFMDDKNGGADRVQAMEKRMKGDVIPPPRRADPLLGGIVLKMIAYDPSQRYQTAAELLEALEQYNGAS